MHIKFFACSALEVRYKFWMRSVKTGLIFKRTPAFLITYIQRLFYMLTNDCWPISLLTVIIEVTLHYANNILLYRCVPGKIPFIGFTKISKCGNIVFKIKSALLFLYFQLNFFFEIFVGNKKCQTVNAFILYFNILIMQKEDSTTLKVVKLGVNERVIFF